MPYKKTPGIANWDYPEIEDWDDDDYRNDNNRCLPLAALFVAATGPFLFCYPRRFCYPHGFCYPRSYCRPYYFCYPRPCYPA